MGDNRNNDNNNVFKIAAVAGIVGGALLGGFLAYRDIANEEERRRNEEVRRNRERARQQQEQLQEQLQRQIQEERQEELQLEQFRNNRDEIESEIAMGIRRDQERLRQLGLLQWDSEDSDDDLGQAELQGRQSEAQGGHDDREQIFHQCGFGRGSRDKAYAWAKTAGNGAEPIHNRPHKVGGQAHFHPGGPRNQTNRHFLYGPKATRDDFPRFE